MNVIDQILNEWSFRCHDGIVDLDDPKKAKILLELLKPILTEDIDDDILNALVASDSSTKEKILKYLKRIGDTNNNEKLEEEVAVLLKPKIGRDDMIKQVIFIADSKQFDLLPELKTYLENPIVTYDNLINNNNLNELFSPTKFPQEFIDKIIDIKGSGQPSIGRGEIALAIFLKNTYKAKVGDIISSGNPIEVKASGAKIMDKDIKIVNRPEIINNPKFQNITQQYGEYKKGTWVEYIQSTYKKSSNKDEYIDNVNSLLNDLYSGVNIKIEDKDLQRVDTFNKKIAVSIAKKYLSDQNLLVFNSTTKDYIYIEGYKDYAEKIYDGILSANNASDSIPRIFY